ncbi:MAG: rod shape-determining protein [Actinomycetota bacterium]
MLGAVGGRDLAVDLGTANTLIYVRGAGVVLDEPSVVAINVNTRRPVAVGVEAKRMIGRTPSHIQAVRPLKDGVIADFDVCEEMLRFFIDKVAGNRWGPRPRMVICVPSGITGVEQRAVRDAAEFAGAREAVVIEEPMAAALGAGLPVDEPVGSMVVDIGGGTTEVAIIALGGLVVARSLRVGGDALDRAVIEHARRDHGLALGERTAETIKVKMGSAQPLVEEFEAKIRGRDLVSGLPRTVVASTGEVREAMADTVGSIIGAVTAALDEAPAELAGDIIERGMVLTGGGALLRGLAGRFEREVGVPVRTADDPLHTVVLGSGRFLEANRLTGLVGSRPG